MSKKFIFVNSGADYEESVGAFEQSDHINITTGPTDAAKPIITDSDGVLDPSFYKDYVDAVAAGFGPKRSVRLATTALLNALYANGTSGVGATLTNAGAQIAFAADSVNAALGDRILVKNQAAFVLGTANMSAGHDFSDDSETFSISRDGGSPVVVTLDTDTTDVATTVTEINASLTTAAINTYYEAYASGNFVGIRAKSPAVDRITLIQGATNDALVILGWLENATSGYQELTSVTDPSASLAQAYTFKATVDGVLCTGDVNGDLSVTLGVNDSFATIATAMATAINTDFGGTVVGVAKNGTSGKIRVTSIAVGADSDILMAAPTAGSSLLTLLTGVDSAVSGIDGTIENLQNGIFEVSTLGSGSTNWVLTRSTDFDNSPDGEIMPGDFFPVEEGTVNAGRQFYQVAFGEDTNDIVGVNGITFTVFANPVASHTHVSTDITDFDEAAQDAVGGIVGNTTSINISYADNTPSITAVVNANGIDDTMIDWGTSTNQVSAVDMPIADTGTVFVAEDVEAALLELYNNGIGTTYVAGAQIYKGDLVYVHTDGKVYEYDIDGSQFCIGIAMNDAAGNANVRVARNDTICTWTVDGNHPVVASYANPGDKAYYIMDGGVGRWSTAAPNGTGKYVWLGGICLANNSMHVEVGYVAKRA